MKKALLFIGMLMVFGLIGMSQASAWYNSWGFVPSYGAYAYNSGYYGYGGNYYYSPNTYNSVLDYSSKNSMINFAENSRSDTYNFVGNNRNYYSTGFASNPNGYGWKNGGYDYEGWQGSGW